MVHEVLQGFAGIEYEDHDFSITAREMSWLLFCRIRQQFEITLPQIFHPSLSLMTSAFDCIAKPSSACASCVHLF